MLAKVAKNIKVKKNIPQFEVKDNKDFFHTEENLARLEKSAQQLENGQVVNVTFDELRKLING